MLKVTIKHLTNGKVDTFFAEEGEVRNRLREEFPEARQFFQVKDVVQAINEYGDAEVEVVLYQYKAPPLPHDYLTHEESEDPWPREG